MLKPNLITLFTAPLEQARINYMITGSIATIAYGEPRLTHDIDLVLALQQSQIESLLKSFPLDAFYAPPSEALILEVQRASRAHFNLIHHATGFKADCYLVGNDPLHIWAMQHRQRIELDQHASIWLAPPEYVIVRKLEFYREGESAKHLDDIRKMLPHLETLDTHWLQQQLQQRGLEEYWHDLQK
jgi:hypothetical protein